MKYIMTAIVVVLGLGCSLASAAQSASTQSQDTTLSQQPVTYSHALTSGVTSPVISPLLFDTLSKEKQTSLASVFGLQTKEYQTYLYYMNQTIDGYEYQHKTNPNIILAMHAKNEADYKHYLTNAIKEDHDSIARLVKVSADFTRLAKQLYPHELPVMMPNAAMNVKNGLRAGDVIQLFCDVSDSTCSNLLGVILPHIKQVNDTKLDVFAVGNAGKQGLISFAKHNNVSPALVNSGKVTLNYGDGMFHQLELSAHKTLPLPFVTVRRAGKEMPVNMAGVS